MQVINTGEKGQADPNTVAIATVLNVEIKSADLQIQYRNNLNLQVRNIFHRFGWIIIDKTKGETCLVYSLGLTGCGSITGELL